MSSRHGFFIERRDAVTITASRSLTEKDSGTVYIVNAADLTITLPSAKGTNMKGVFYRVFVTSTGAGGSVGLTVAVGANDKFRAKGITAANSKGVINTHATAAEGDAVLIECDGTDWWGVFTGTWARVS